MTGLAPTQALRRRLLENLYPREQWLPSEWAVRCRVLSSEESSEPGPYNPDRTPYWQFLLDLLVKPGIEELVCLKGAQIGWSEFCRNYLGYCIDLDPGPCLIVMADQKSAEDFRQERIEPLLVNTPAIARHLTNRAHDKTTHRVKLDTMSLFFVWAGSKTGTKSRPIRYLICEEPDEFPAFSSTGGDPLAKALKRITTYSDKGRARVLIGGTPTTRMGNVFKRWELCAVRYHPWVPCPHCQGYQLLQWKQVRWPDLKDIADRPKRAAKIQSEALAYYQCEHCPAQIRDHDKPDMLRRGLWATEDQAVTRDGRVVGEEPTARRVGAKISSLYSPWVPFGTLAAEWIEAQGDPDALCDFINQRLAEPFEQQRAKTEPDLFQAKAKGAPPPLIVPAWARVLIATADTQGTDDKNGYFWYVIRCWAAGYRSQLIDFGVAVTKAELRQRCLDRPLVMDVAGGNGKRNVAPQMLLVDSGGHRFQEVYEMSQADPRIHPTKGASTRRSLMMQERPQKNHQVVLWEIDTDQAKDLLHLLIHDPDRGRWMVHNAINEDYCRQMCAEAKIFDPRLQREIWSEIVKNNNHLWDCEAMQVAAAWRIGCGAPEPPDAPPGGAGTAPKKPKDPDKDDPGGWLPERAGKWLNR